MDENKCLCIYIIIHTHRSEQDWTQKFHTSDTHINLDVWSLWRYDTQAQFGYGKQEKNPTKLNYQSKDDEKIVKKFIIGSISPSSCNYDLWAVWPCAFSNRSRSTSATFNVTQLKFSTNCRSVQGRRQCYRPASIRRNKSAKCTW